MPKGEVKKGRRLLKNPRGDWEVDHKVATQARLNLRTGPKGEGVTSLKRG